MTETIGVARLAHQKWRHETVHRIGYITPLEGETPIRPLGGGAIYRKEYHEYVGYAE